MEYGFFSLAGFWNMDFGFWNMDFGILEKDMQSQLTLFLENESNVTFLPVGLVQTVS